MITAHTMQTHMYYIVTCRVNGFKLLHTVTFSGFASANSEAGLARCNPSWLYAIQTAILVAIVAKMKTTVVQGSVENTMMTHEV